MNAKEVLMNAVLCDQAGRILQAQELYQKGITLLMAMVEVEEDAAKKKVFYARIKEYISRAEEIQTRVQHQIVKGNMVAHIKIAENSSGHSYRTLFGEFLTEDVQEVLVEEAYLYEKHQFQNLIILLELVVKNCRKIKYVRVVTKSHPGSPDNQRVILEEIKKNLMGHDVELNFRFEDTLHDRKIVLSNGYIIKIGRGLDFFKPTSPLYSLGLCDYDFRRCKQTDVDIWRTKDFNIK